jgi:predicted Zn-dependent protease with MMP-like domain
MAALVFCDRVRKKRPQNVDAIGSEGAAIRSVASEVVREVRGTVVYEIGHCFWLDDDEMSY